MSDNYITIMAIITAIIIMIILYCLAYCINFLYSKSNKTDNFKNEEKENE